MWIDGRSESFSASPQADDFGSKHGVATRSLTRPRSRHKSPGTQEGVKKGWVGAYACCAFGLV